MADIAHRITDEKLEVMERHLSAIYRRAEKEIQKTADDYFGQFRRMDLQKQALVKAGKLSEEEYTTWRKNKMLYSKRFTEMKQECAEQLLHTNETALAYINGQLPEVYALNYNALEKTVDGVGGYSFSLTSADVVKKLATKDASLLPYKYLDIPKDMLWNTKKLNAEVLQGILQGDSIPKIAKRLRNVATMDESAAVRNARTMITGAENKGRLDSFEIAQDSGINLRKKWISTLDSRTRHAHAELDGKTVGMKEQFVNAIGPIMYPGDPAADPANVYNCRCTMVASVGQRKDKSRIARNADGKSVLVENMTYSEWVEWRKKGKK